MIKGNEMRFLRLTKCVNEAFLEISKRCNANCPFCYAVWHDHPEKIGNEITIKKWIDIVSNLVEAGVEVITLSGGEPLIRDDFMLLLRHIMKQERISHCCIYTNLLKMNAQLLGAIKDPRIEICTSLQGLTTYQSMIGCEWSVANWANNCRSVVRSGCSLSICIVVTKRNLFELDDMIRYADRLNPRIIQVGPMLVEGRAKLHPELWLSYNDIGKINEVVDSLKLGVKSEIIVVAESFCSCRSDRIVPDGMPKGVKELPCTVDHEMIVIGPDGRRRRCIHTWEA